MSDAKFHTNHPPLVAPLSQFNSKDLLLAGGKGANLGELLESGFEVPAGFVITTTAYDLLVQDNNLQTRLSQILGTLDLGDSNSAHKVSDEIQTLLQETSIPKQLFDEILRGYQELGDGAVAVRSSATAEDLPEAAFAGQQETFLNVIGEKALLDAVRDCWMSLWSERAIIYRARHNIDQAGVKLAVVVQKMIEADTAGVMFTANPVSGVRDELVIDANPGLGEAVVGGLVTPDHFVVNKHSQRLQEKKAGRKEVVVQAKRDGGIERIKPKEAALNRFALPSQAITKLSRLGIDIERHFGRPQDIEWAWIQDNSKLGKFFILQARPMTALPEPIKISGPMRLVVPMLAEMWPTRPYPLDMTTFTGTIERAIGNLLVVMIGKSAPSPDESFTEEDGVVVQFKPPAVHPSVSMLFTPWITLWKTRKYNLSHWEVDPLLIGYIAKAQAIEKRDLQPLTWMQNVGTIKEALALIPQAMKLRERYLPKAILGLAVFWLLLSLARRGGQFGILVSGVRTKTTETNEALEELARQIRNDRALKDIFAREDVKSIEMSLKVSKEGQEFLKQFDHFLDQYGHREIALTISQPAWKDNPENVLGILKVLVEGEAQKPRSYDSWQKARDKLLTHSLLGSRLLRNLFLKSLTYTRYLFQIREDTHFYATMVQPAIRHVALELGKRLLEIGAIDSVEDVFHLKLDELEDFGKEWPPAQQKLMQIRSLVSRRKVKRQSLVNKPMIDPRLLTTTSQRQGEIILNGASGSPGIARGPVRVVHDVSEFGKLRTGEVLVAPFTNPSWTPLFQRAIAVVVDTGGSASHAAIVAREYGIPAVMGTMNGTKELTDGQWIEVDGSRGFVFKAETKK